MQTHMCIRGVVQINFKLLPSLNASMGSTDSKLKGMNSGLPTGYLRPTRCLWLDSFQQVLMLKMHLWQFLCLKSDQGIYGLGSIGKTNKQKSTRKLRPDPKSAVNNGETIWTEQIWIRPLYDINSTVQGAVFCRKPFPPKYLQ